jgi:hypothetical protein
MWTKYFWNYLFSEFWPSTMAIYMFSLNMYFWNYLFSEFWPSTRAIYMFSLNMFFSDATNFLPRVKWFLFLPLKKVVPDREGTTDILMDVQRYLMRDMTYISQIILSKAPEWVNNHYNWFGWQMNIKLKNNLVFFVRHSYRRRHSQTRAYTHPYERTHTHPTPSYEHLWRTELDRQILRLMKSS